MTQTPESSAAVRSGRPALPRAWALLVLAGMGVSGVLWAGLSIDLARAVEGLYACPLRALLDAPCPGCGLTRACLLLGQLRFAEALALHPLSPIVAGACLFSALGLVRVSDARAERVAPLALAALLAVWLLRAGGLGTAA